MYDVTKIVITGGPCAGKSTAMTWIQEHFTKLGYKVLSKHNGGTLIHETGRKEIAICGVLLF